MESLLSDIQASSHPIFQHFGTNESVLALDGDLFRYHVDLISAQRNLFSGSETLQKMLLFHILCSSAFKKGCFPFVEQIVSKRRLIGCRLHLLGAPFMSCFTLTKEIIHFGGFIDSPQHATFPWAKVFPVQTHCKWMRDKQIKFFHYECSNTVRWDMDSFVATLNAEQLKFSAFQNEKDDLMQMLNQVLQIHFLSNLCLDFLHQKLDPLASFTEAVGWDSMQDTSITKCTACFLLL